MAFDDTMVDIYFDRYQKDIEKTIAALRKEFTLVKASRANSALVEDILVDYYGVQTPIKQLANFSTPEARVLVISVWDKTAIPNVSKAIAAANIGINPMDDGKVIRLIFPELTEESRKELCKKVRAMGENAKVSIRNHRRVINDGLKKLEKNGDISEDYLKRYEDNVEKITAENILEIEQIVKAKEQEVLIV